MQHLILALLYTILVIISPATLLDPACKIMDNPNAGVTFRRHSSLRIDPRRRSTILRRSSTSHCLPAKKSNPYVGWFRHSPPTTAKATSQAKTTRVAPSCAPPRTSTSSKHQVPPFKFTPAAAATTCSVSKPTMKNSPYVGWFRHAPPRSIRNRHLSALEKELVTILQQIPPQEQDGVMRIRDLLSGHLRGGGNKSSGYPYQPHETTMTTPYDRDQTIESFCRTLQASTANSSSVTLKILTRVICWFLLPAHDCNHLLCHPKTLYSTDEETITSYEETLSSLNDQDELDNYDTVSGSGEQVLTSSPQEDLGNSISSQAEAYYAHQSSEERFDQDHYSASEGEHRLDYVITQMDIARMSRNASRHLDVESITQLPTITYRSKEEKAAPAPLQQQQEDRVGLSWIMVQQSLGIKDTTPDTQQEDARNEERDVCVICLEHFLNGDRLRVLPCDHSFHVGCIDRWLSGSHSFVDCVTSGCPTCKKHPCDRRDVSESSSDGSVPSWAFARIGNALVQDARHF